MKYPSEAEAGLEALLALLALNAPVADWEQMEEEIIQASIGDDCATSAPADTRSDSVGHFSSDG